MVKGKASGEPMSGEAAGAEEGRDRRADILKAAERLFADKGYAGASIREIAARASVPVALVRYYFGRKKDLLEFIFAEHRYLIDERMEKIRAVDGRPGPARAERVIRAWAAPVLRERAAEAEGSYSLLVARSIWEVDDVNRRIVERHYDPLARCFVAAMRLALPNTDEATLFAHYEWSLGALLAFIADSRVERLSGGAVKAGDAAYAERLIRFIAGGFMACGEAESPSPR